MDVHPPLGKLIIAASSSFFGKWILTIGYNGSFSFKEIGMDYPKEVPFVAMRSASALFGSALIPVT
jgi:dolichyl-phosphate-mannose-protein mannosyltransferase